MVLTCWLPSSEEGQVAENSMPPRWLVFALDENRDLNKSTSSTMRCFDRASTYTRPLCQPEWILANLIEGAGWASISMTVCAGYRSNLIPLSDLRERERRYVFHSCTKAALARRSCTKIPTSFQLARVRSFELVDRCNGHQVLCWLFKAIRDDTQRP